MEVVSQAGEGRKGAAAPLLHCRITIKSSMCWFVLAPSDFPTKYGSVGWLLSAAAQWSSMQCKIFAFFSWWWQTKISVMFCPPVLEPRQLLSCYHNSNLTDDWLAILQTKSWCDLSLQIQSWIKCKFIIIQPTSPAQPGLGLGLSFCLFLISRLDLSLIISRDERDGV